MTSHKVEQSKKIITYLNIAVEKMQAGFLI